MSITRRYAGLMLGLLTLLAAGCGPADHTGQAPSPQPLAADAPAARGLPVLRPPELPSPLMERAPFGLYAHSPTNDTLTTLASGTLSPDGRFRTASTPQGIWVARADGAWVWEVQLPAPPPPAGSETRPGTQAPGLPAVQPPPTAPAIVGTPGWTPRITLLLQDDTGAWHEADPASTRITPMAAFFRGKQDLALSPDGKQVLYYIPGKAGRQLWIAKIEGTEARLQGENLSGVWDKSGKLVTVQEVKPGPQTKVTEGPGSILDTPGR